MKFSSHSVEVFKRSNVEDYIAVHVRVAIACEHAYKLMSIDFSFFIPFNIYNHGN